MNTTLDTDEKKFYRSIVRTVGKDSIRDIVRHGCGGGYPGITYYSDILNFIKKNKKFIQNLIRCDIEDGALVANERHGSLECFSLHGTKLETDECMEINYFVYFGRYPKNGPAIAWIGWYAIESFLSRID